MKIDTDAVTSETTSEETTSENKAETTAQNNGLSPEATAEMQARIDALTAEALKYKTKADQQEGRAKKAESALKADKNELAGQLDEYRQKQEIAETNLEQLKQQNAILINGQRSTAVQNAVLAVAGSLADGAAQDLASLMVGKVGIQDGRVTVLTETGTSRISAKTGKEMTVDELRDELLSKRPYFVKSGVVSGQGTGDNTGGATAAIDLTQWRNADPAKIQKHLAGQSKEYKDKFMAAIAADMRE